MIKNTTRHVSYVIVLLMSIFYSLNGVSSLADAIAQSCPESVYSLISAAPLSKEEKRIFIKTAKEKRIHAEQELDAQTFNRRDIMHMITGTSGIFLTAYSGLLASVMSYVFLNASSEEGDVCMFLVSTGIATGILGYFTLAQLRKGVFSETRKNKLMRALAIENMLYTSP